MFILVVFEFIKFSVLGFYRGYSEDNFGKVFLCGFWYFVFFSSNVNVLFFLIFFLGIG